MTPVGRDGSEPFVGSREVVASRRTEASEEARTQLEQDLRQVESRNRTLVEQLPQVTYIEQLDGQSASYISPQIKELVGYTPEEWTSDAAFFGRVLHPDDRERVLADFAEMHASGDRFECEYRLVRRDQRIVWVHDGAVVVRDEAGRPVYAQGFMVDISGRKDIENALRESEQRFRDLVSGIDVIVWEADPDLNFSFVSKRAEDILGYPVERWLAEPGFIIAYLHPDDKARVLAADRGALARGEDYELEYRVLAADGRSVWFREIVRVELGDDGHVDRLRGVMVDVTAQKGAAEVRAGLEQQLGQAQKMEAVGRLAGGIAHDFNNLLTVISGYSGLALVELGEAHEQIRTHLGEIQSASERAASLTQRLLAFSRQQVMSPKVLDLNETVARVEKLLGRLIGDDVDLVTVLEGQTLFVEADPAQLEQVLINLALNARDAMPEGGSLTMATSLREIDDATADETPDAHAGTFAVVSVTDTGLGIDEATKLHLFEPFFTTKEVGKGTGLGLASVYGTVRQSDGFVTVESEVGRGASFRVFLPFSAATADGASHPHPEEHVGTTRGSETILLVEDEEAVRNLTTQALELNGYRVVAAASPAEALGLGEDEPYDLLLTDVVMPEMRGGELARRLREDRPGLKTLFMSGYLAGEALLGEEEPVAFLQKPFSLDELARTVRELLDS
jgi:two-component system, cell cycle sensor histidine kinase and response regulator CckA